jgi:23S rRNA pseudouridine955/2504/2580 synthase
MSRVPKKKSPVQQIIVNSDDESRRIDNFLMSHLKDLPRTRIYQMLRRGEVRVNKGRVKQSYRLKIDDVVRIPPVLLNDEADLGRPPAFLIDLIQSAVLFEDEHIIALNKPSGVVVHSGSGRSFGVIEVLRYLRPEQAKLQLAHRIDQATSGCLLLSKSNSGLQHIHQALRNGEMQKKYISLLSGDIGRKTVRINAALKKNTVRSGERLVRVDSEGKQAESSFTRTRVYENSCLVDITIKTGRTHQIRVHAQHMGHVIAGDSKYGDEAFNKKLRKAGLKRLFLHASHLELSNYGKKGLYIQAPLTPELVQFLASHN